MDKFVIQGGSKLYGQARLQAAKNAVLPLLAASVLTDDPVTIRDLPNITDVENMLHILSELGCAISRANDAVSIDSKNAVSHEIPSTLTRELRSSVFMLGSVLTRFRRAKISYPGGCDIGLRPIDLHLSGLKRLGVTIIEENGYVICSAERLRGADILLDFPSVGATENILLAATRAKGITTIENAAAEPEICDLADFLRKMGAEIEGDGTDTITIRGGKELHGAVHRVIPDRMEAGTFLAAAAITGGDIILENVQEEHLKPVLAKLAECNIKTERTAEGIRVRRRGRLCGVQVKTMPFPGFPTDMQAPFMSLLAVAKGTSVMTETIFENRFSHVGELQRMGANIKIDSRSAVIEGVETLTGAKVRATDLRAGAALILSALAAKGETEISDIYHIERGYDRIDEKLRRLGADIRREEE